MIEQIFCLDFAELFLLVGLTICATGFLVESTKEKSYNQ